jgi:hypothetical protein
MKIKGKIKKKILKAYQIQEKNNKNWQNPKKMLKVHQLLLLQG